MSIASSENPSIASVPPLQPGDRLDAREFERRYEAMPPDIRAELIEGIVYMQASAKLNHGQPLAFLTAWIVHYCMRTPGTDYAGDATDRLDDSNQPQPDIALFVLPECGGRTTVSDDGYLTGGPELIVEVAGSSLAVDRGPKLRTYERHGVGEYVIWRVNDRMIEWYVRRDGVFQLHQRNEDGVYRSETFPGLWLHEAFALQRNATEVMRVLDLGTKSAEHTRFVSRLNSHAR